MKHQISVPSLLIVLLVGVIAPGCLDLEEIVTPDGPALDEIMNDNVPEPDPIDPETTICDSLDWAPYESHCGDMMLDRTDLNAGDVLTVTVNLTCGGAKIACDYAEQGLTEVDGQQVPESASTYPEPYRYDPPRPHARRNGSVVDLGGGQHTIRFFLKFSAPNDCLTVTDENLRAEGPMVYLGPGGAYWSSVQSFRIRQTGI